MRNRLRYCIWKQWMNGTVRSKKGLGDLFSEVNRLRMGCRRRYRAFLQPGITPAWARRFAWSRKGGWTLACSPVMGMSVTEDRLRQKGYVPFLEYYLSVKYKDA